MRKLLLITVLPLLLLVSCNVATDESGEKTYSVDPNTAIQVEAGVEGTAGVLTLLTPLFGPSVTIAGSALLAALGVWRKLKPRYVEAQNKAEVANTVAGSMVDAIDALKKDYPEDWKHLEPLLIKGLDIAGIDNKVLENVIRGLRGLPPKG